MGAMVDDIHAQTFRRGSKTYYNSTRFFPPVARRDVYLLYAFVRTADNFVDARPQDAAGFAAFEQAYHRARAGTRDGDPIIDGFVELAERRAFDPAWIDAFFRSMRSDLGEARHTRLERSIEYMYGSAEVIGLFMARILDLPREADGAARMLGRAMQYLNFLRDIAEDNELGRVYLPIDESDLDSLSYEEATAKPQRFIAFMRAQLQRFDAWQREAERGYRLIPLRFRVPIKTAADMYKWTGRQIARDPFVVYRRKVKPARARIVARGLLNWAGGCNTR